MTSSPNNPRVLIVAENASLKFGGEATKPFLFFQFFRKRGMDVRLLVHSRCRGELEAAFPRDLADRARSRWPVVRLSLLHRTGRVPLGDPSVLVAVATPHRADAFEACRYLIDTLKAEAAIWKKEVWSDGTGSWVHPKD